MPFENRLSSEVIAVSVRQWQRRGDDDLDRLRGVPRSRAGGFAASVAAPLSRVMTHIISAFALYATAMHPEFVWPPADHEPADEADDARSIWQPWAGA